MSDSLVVKGGKLVLHSGIIEADILIVDDRIKAIGKDLKGGSVFNANGMLIFPGVIDEHVHMREPGLTYKDDFNNGTKAAAAGGVTTVLEMPNTKPPVDSAERLMEKAQLLTPKAHVDFGLYGVIHNANAQKFEEMVEAGAIGFKIFLGPTTGNIPSPDDGTLFDVLKKSAKMNVVLAFHAENGDLVRYFIERFRHRKDPAVHTDSRPSVCEEESIRKLMLFSRETGGRVHIVHMSAKEGVRILREARSRGINMTGETNPHYLLLTRKDYEKFGTSIKVNPPIRDEEDREELWRAVNDGTIIALASDHAPHSKEEKEGDIWTAAAGFIGVQTLFPLMLDAAIKGRMSLEKLSYLTSEGPARLFGLYPNKGTIMPGSYGDLTIVDPKAEFTITEEWLYAKYPITPFIGWKLQGKVVVTILRGRIIAENGKIVGKPSGKWIKKGG